MQLHFECNISTVKATDFPDKTDKTKTLSFPFPELTHQRVLFTSKVSWGSHLTYVCKFERYGFERYGSDFP